jgi:hypothetical protein
VSSINSKMGMKPRTRTRAATHGRTIVSDAQCPACGCRHVIENTIRGERLRLCAGCSHIWPAPEISSNG